MEGSLETLFAGVASRANPAGMLTIPDEVRCLDTNDLEKLESAFRAWVAKGRGAGVTLARRRILALFLLLRHTGARLGEASGLEGRSLVLEKGLVRLGTPPRDVLVAETVLAEIVGLVTTGGGRESPVLPEYPFAVDPGHVRRKFYACAEAAGLGREMGSPSVLRRSRAVELLRGNASKRSATKGMTPWPRSATYRGRAAAPIPPTGTASPHWPPGPKPSCAKGWTTCSGVMPR